MLNLSPQIPASAPDSLAYGIRRDSGYIHSGFAVFSERMQPRRSTLWFILAAAWAVLLVLNILRHREKNAVVIGIAVAAFVITGIVYQRRDAKLLRRRKDHVANKPE